MIGTSYLILLKYTVRYFNNHETFSLFERGCQDACQRLASAL